MFIEDSRSLPQLSQVLLSETFKRHKFQIRVYRRSSLHDYRDFATTKDEVETGDIEQFIYRSTFVGDGPDVIRSLNTDNIMRIFTQDDPALFLFFNQLDEVDSDHI